MDAERILEFTRRIFHSAMKRHRRYLFLKEFSKHLFDFSSCDAIEVKHQDGDLCYSWQAFNVDQFTTRFTNIPSLLDKTKQAQSSLIESLCKLVLQNGTNPESNCFTQNGSFWSNDLGNLPDSIKQNTGFVRLDSLKDQEKYKALAIFPFRIRADNYGLLIIKHQKQDFFKSNEIQAYEEISQTFGLAASEQQVQSALQERVKELTCLYGIARIAQHQKSTLKEKLQKIVEILPPSWQYPDLAAARILLDGTAYSTIGFHEGPYQQTADIYVNDKKRGIVELVYIDDRPELKAVPFLAEEASLIEEIARQIGAIVEKVDVEKEKALLQEQLRHADRLATLGQLSAGVAHEINEPLGNILGFAQLAKKALPESSQAGQDLNRIENASLQAREIIRNMLIFSRQIPTSKTTVNLNDAIQNVLQFFRNRCAKEGIELNCQFMDTIPTIEADSSQINQLLVNLMVNAIHAMPEGGTLTLKTYHNSHSVILEVKDTGIGIAEEIINRVFDPFFTTKDVNQGTGLGLSVVHGIVTTHKGTIEVENTPGAGACFKVKLPKIGTGKRSD